MSRPVSRDAIFAVTPLIKAHLNTLSFNFVLAHSVGGEGRSVALTDTVETTGEWCRQGDSKQFKVVSRRVSKF